MGATWLTLRSSNMREVEESMTVTAKMGGGQ